MIPAFPLTHATPESQGVSSSAINAFIDAAQRHVDSLHSFMLLRHGQLIAAGWWEPYRPDDPHMLYSLSKSFTSTAIGMLVAEGKLSPDDPVLAFFPGEAPAQPSTNLQKMRVRHLLTMTTGHADEPQPGREGTWMRDFLAHPVVYEPGTHFLYNTAATYMLSAIVQRQSGVRLLSYLLPRLFVPLGITDPTWEVSPEGIDTGGYGLNITTEAIARFGQLYLQKGIWQGARLLGEEWVEAATNRQVSNAPNTNPDWEQGYGYQFWRCRHGAYRGDGAFGQFCLVMPAQDAVLAITAGVSTMQAVLDLVWRHLLPAMGAVPLNQDVASQEMLASRLVSLRLPPVVGSETSPLAASISGKTFRIEANSARVETVRFDFTESGCVLTLRSALGEERVPCGYSTWLRGGAISLNEMRHTGQLYQLYRVAASGAWKSNHVYEVGAWAYETPFKWTLICTFDDTRLSIEQQLNVSFGSTDLPRLEGRLV